MQTEVLKPLSMPGANAEYLEARARLREAEHALTGQIERVAQMRRAMPAGPEVRDYTFIEGDNRVRLSELFAPGTPYLFVYHLMYWADDNEFCPMCSTWVDGLDGVGHHIEQYTNAVVATRAPFDVLRDWAKRRGWRRLRMVSDDGAGFARDLGAEDDDGDPIETVAVFAKDSHGTIRHCYTQHASENFRPVRGIDLLCPLWHAFDLLPSGRDEFLPRNDYAVDAAGDYGVYK